MMAENAFDASSPTTDGSPVGHGLPRWKGSPRTRLLKAQESECLICHVS
jgi:hypothetical protein